MAHEDRTAHDQQLLSAKEVASRLSITLRSAYTLLHAGKLPGKKIGKNWYIHPADFERALRGGFAEVRESESRGTEPRNSLDASSFRESLSTVESSLTRLKEA